MSARNSPGGAVPSVIVVPSAAKLCSGGSCSYTSSPNKELLHHPTTLPMATSPVDVFKVPMTPAPAGRSQSQHQRCSPVATSTSLKTPEKQYLPSPSAGGLQEVRKRPLEVSPEDISVKKKNVAKTLLFNSPDVTEKTANSRNASRCIFGPPDMEESRRILDEFYKKSETECTEMLSRYSIVETIHVTYR